jgi:hypothetical protein
MRISAAEQELLIPEITLFARALRDPAAQTRYHELRAAVEEGEVEDELLGHLGNVLEIGLQSGRLRKLYGADGEQASVVGGTVGSLFWPITSLFAPPGV